MDKAQILNICQGFKYEIYEKNNFVFRQGDPSNNKFYIILSGEIAVVNSQRLGDFGELPLTSTNIFSAKSPRNKTFLTATSHSKSSTVSSVKDLEKKVSSVKTLNSLDIKKPDNKKTLTRKSCLLIPEDSSSPKISSVTSIDGGKKLVNKMRAVCDAVKALRTMQKCLPGSRKFGEQPGFRSLTDLDSKVQGSTVATLQHLDIERELEDDEDGKKDFEDYVQNFGKVTQYLGVGESFGEIASKKNQPRSASILCRTRCEFLTLEKQQFDEVFGRIEKEKEEFLITVFPSLHSFSTANFNFLSCCFKVNYLVLK